MAAPPVDPIAAYFGYAIGCVGLLKLIGDYASGWFRTKRNSEEVPELEQRITEVGKASEDRDRDHAKADEMAFSAINSTLQRIELSQERAFSDFKTNQAVLSAKVDTLSGEVGRLRDANHKWANAENVERLREVTKKAQ